ncbi:MAG TPA: hypothetical protein VLP43_11550 [Solirubrobacteraceae bacterium]|nr:hypothetical protein [Solirubrobacteraceae bacterium]
MAAFIVLTALLALTAVTLISQRQRTVLLNRQLGALVGETTLVLDRVRPALGAVPASSATIRSRASAVSDLVNQSRPLVRALSASGLPDTVSATGSLVRALSASGLPNTVTAAGQLIASLQQQNGLSMTLADLDGLITEVRRANLVPRASTGIDALLELVQLQQRTLRLQEATLATGRENRTIAAHTLVATRQALATAAQTLAVAQQTLEHAASLDRKVGPVP